MKDVMMKAIFKKFFFFFGLLNYKTGRNFINRTKDFIKRNCYLGRVSAQVAHLGDNNVINGPLEIIGGKYISIGNNVAIGKNGVISAWDNYMNVKYTPRLTLGNDIIIGNYCHITSINRIEIKNGALMGKWVTITDNAHGRSEEEDLLIPPVKRNLYSPGPVIIDENVWIGDKVTILPNVYIGKNAIIGANSVVTKDIPDNCVAAGVPAKVIKIISRPDTEHKIS
jgi:acetyltransferase-like isoleucine patch superfamily enzyme